MRQALLSSREPHRVELPQLGAVWLRVPTAKDAIDADGKGAGRYN